jgi:hypothetical protein
VNKFDMLSQSDDKFRSSANAVSAAPLDLNLSIGLSSFAEADIATAHVRFASFVTVSRASVLTVFTEHGIRAQLVGCGVFL